MWGTTVKLYLPRSPELQPAEAAIEVEAQPKTAAGTALVVEDDPDVRGIAVEVLRGLGYRVLEAADGKAALRTLGALPVELPFEGRLIHKPYKPIDLAREISEMLGQRAI